MSKANRNYHSECFGIDEPLPLHHISHPHLFRGEIPKSDNESITFMADSLNQSQYMSKNIDWLQTSTWSAPFLANNIYIYIYNYIIIYI